MWQERDWRRLFMVIHALPRTSLTKEAMAQDDDLVNRMIQANGHPDDEDRPSAGPRLSEWSPEVEYLVMAIDRLSDVIAVEQAMAGKKPRKIAPVRRPTTAWDRASRRRRDARHARLVSQLLPNGPQELPGESA